MKRIIRASKDTYITNRIIGDRFRATDSNVGLAGTLDLFKLAGESTISYVTASFSGSAFIAGTGPFVSGTIDPVEISRILIKFDLDPLRALTSSILDFTNPVISSSFSCVLKLTDVFGGQPVPSNFTLVTYPLSKSFDEGIGRDVYSFEDIDACNFITASVSGDTAVTWSQSSAQDLTLAGSGALVFIGGASHLGYVGQELIDAMTGSSALGDVFTTQTFSSGDEDMSVDVTKIVSATLAGLLPDHGLLISYSGSQETDDRTRFVKRFASRHSTNTRIRPKIIVGFNDSIQDHHNNFIFDVSGTLFLNSFVRNSYAFTGSTGLLLTLTTGSIASGTYYSTSVTATQFRTGLYSASFAISSNVTQSLKNEIMNAGSATFIETWGSLDGTTGYYTGSLVIYDLTRTAFSNVNKNYKINITNMKRSYRSDEVARFRVFAQDDGWKFKQTKLPVAAKSLIFDNMHYRIRDSNSDEIIYDFDTIKNSTRMSTDSDGMYFDVHISDLDISRVYSVDMLLIERGSTEIYTNVGGGFRVD